MTDKDFTEYKYHILKQLDSFQNCREAHQKNFYDMNSSINKLGDDVKNSIDRLSDKITHIDKRLNKVEIKSGLWGAIAGMAPFFIYYFTKN